MSRISPTSISVGQVSVTIDRLVIGGLDPAARSAFVAGLREHLAEHLSKMLADPATLASFSSGSRRTPVLRLGRIPLQPGHAGARHLGAQVARSIAASGSASSIRRRVRP